MKTKQSIGLRFKLKLAKKESRRTRKDGFNGYGRYRSKSNVPYGVLSQLQKVSGIYYLKNIVTNKIYIGSSTNIGSRISKHFSQLHKGNHPNTLLIEDYNKHGVASFIFGVLEECNENLHEKEREHQITFNKDCLYNLLIKKSYVSDKFLDDIKNRDFASHKTEKYRNAMRKLKQNKIGQFTRDGLLIEIFNNSDEVCSKFKMAKSTLLGCCNGSKKTVFGYVWRYLDKDNNILAEGKGKHRTILKQNEDIV